MKKMNNKGFSLVELIVVVAIMAVLIGVLAPQYLRYVEKSRLQKDNAALGEVANAIKIACADEAINKQVAAATAGVSYAFSTSSDQDFTTATASPLLDAELKNAVTKVLLSSNTYKSGGVTITVTVSGGTVNISTDSTWMDTPDSTAKVMTF